MACPLDMGLCSAGLPLGTRARGRCFGPAPETSPLHPWGAPGRLPTVALYPGTVHSAHPTVATSGAWRATSSSSARTSGESWSMCGKKITTVTSRSSSVKTTSTSTASTASSNRRKGSGFGCMRGRGVGGRRPGGPMDGR